MQQARAAAAIGTAARPAGATVAAGPGAAVAARSSSCSNASWRARRDWEYSRRLANPGLANPALPPRRRQLRAGDFSERFRNNDGPRAEAVLEARRNGWAPRHAWRPRASRSLRGRGSAPCSGPMPIPIFSTTPSGLTPTTPAIGPTLTNDLLDTVFWGESGPYSAYAS
jgi:hypothetical protein